MNRTAFHSNPLHLKVNQSLHYGAILTLSSTIIVINYSSMDAFDMFSISPAALSQISHPPKSRPRSGYSLTVLDSRAGHVVIIHFKTKQIIFRSEYMLHFLVFEKNQIRVCESRVGVSK